MRVLVVEDERDMASLIQRRLRTEGIASELCHDGIEGLHRAADGDFDVILLDIMLPSMNGYKLCREFRRRGIATPVLMISAKGGEYDEVECFDVGADDFMHKPFSFAVLIARLRYHGQREHGEQTKLSVADLELDMIAQHCVRQDSTIPLTRRERSVLEFLMRNAGSVVTKAQLLDYVWGPEYKGGSNVVEVYIRYLRRKIDEPFERQLIHTVWGLGYRVAA